MGGIRGYHDTETTDENPERVALIQQATTAYLRSKLDLDDQAWSQMHASLENGADPLGQLESK